MSVAMARLCACGCGGKTVGKSRRFVSGHGGRGRRSAESRKRNSASIIRKHGTGQRNKEMAVRVAAGETLAAVGAAFGVSKQRVWQVVLREGVRSTLARPTPASRRYQ